jgi:hypothetical protein
MQIPNWFDYDVKPYLKNPIVFGVLTMIVILYGSYAQQPLPTFMDRLFKSPLFLMGMFFAIVMIGTQDVRAAFIVALASASLMHYYNQRLITEAFLEGLRQEGFEVPFDPNETDMNGSMYAKIESNNRVDPNQILDDPSMDLSMFPSVDPTIDPLMQTSMDPMLDNLAGSPIDAPMDANLWSN